MDLSNVMDQKALVARANCFKRIFFYRICGAGMGPVACLLKEKGLHVEGCDLDFYPPMGTYLKEVGITCYPNEDVSDEMLKSFDLIVVGNTVSSKSEEARRIESLGVALCSFPAALGALVLLDKKVLGICGTHGKTTTTYFAVQVFEALGVCPGYLIGGVMDGRPSSSLGEGKHFFIEGDEYDSAYFHKVSKFRSYQLDSMILTSLEFDHADIFSNLEEIKEQFRLGIKELGQIMICCKEYPAICDLMKDKTPIWYGKEFPLIGKTNNQGTAFTLQWKGESFDFHTNVVGKHNIDNLCSVILYAFAQGFSYRDIHRAVKNLKQVKRRQELKGHYRGCPIIDDFAHHPRAVGLTIKAVQTKFPEKKINVIFGPESATARSNAFQKEFSESFGGVERVLILCSKRDTTAKGLGNMDWKQLQRDILQKGTSKVALSKELETTVEFIKTHAVRDNLFLVLSNSKCQGLWESDFIKELADV